MVPSIERVQDISLRIEQLENTGEWLSRVVEGYDPSAAQAAVLITSLAEDIRARLLDLVTELEKQIVITARTH